MIKLSFKTISIVIFALFVCAAFFAQSANAIPAFARRYEAPCSTCHVAWSLLNETGRDFKVNGFKFSPDDEPENIISDFLKLDENFPVGGIIKLRPYDKKKSGDAKVQAVHAIELVIAGTIYDNISGFIELEAEDADDFEPAMRGYVTYHASELVNVQFSYDAININDPYDTMSGKRRLQASRNVVINQEYGGADGKIRDPRQSVSVYGRPHEKVFYSIGISGMAKDAEGVNARNIHARLAGDIFPGVMIGAFGIFGECPDTACTVDREFTRFGVDSQVEWNDFVFKGAYLQASDDQNDLSSHDNMAWYVEADYIYQPEGRPLWVPGVRFGQYEKADGVDSFTEMTLILGYYLTQNVRLFAEYWTQLDVPDLVEEDDRVTLQIEVGF